MSFITQAKTGRTFEPGWFLADNENCTRLTKEMDATGVEADETGAKIVKMGTVWPSNDANAVGIVYEDVDVSNGNMPGSVVTAGVVYGDRLPEEISSAAASAMTDITVIAEAPVATRPDDGTET